MLSLFGYPKKDRKHVNVVVVLANSLSTNERFNRRGNHFFAFLYNDNLFLNLTMHGIELYLSFCLLYEKGQIYKVLISWIRW